MPTETEVERLVIRLVGDVTQYLNAMQQAQQETRQATNNIETMLGQLSPQFANLRSVLAGLGVPQSFPAFLQLGIQAQVGAEKAVASLRVVTASIEEAKNVIKELKAFEDKTPFEMPEITESAKQLMILGRRGQEMIDTLRVLGDVAAGSGMGLGTLTHIFVQIQNAGQLTERQLMTLSRANVLTIKDVAKFYGVDTARAKQAVAEGQVSASDVQAMLQGMSAPGGKYSGAAETQSQTLGKDLERFREDIKEVANAIASLFIPGLQVILKTFSAIIKVAKDLGGALKAIFPEGLIDIVLNLVKGFILFRSVLIAYQVVVRSTAIVQTVFQAIMSGGLSLVKTLAGVAVAAISITMVEMAFARAGKSAQEAGAQADAAKGTLVEAFENTKTTAEAATEAVRETAKALHEAGKSANRLRDYLQDTKDLLGLMKQAAALPDIAGGALGGAALVPTAIKGLAEYTGGKATIQVNTEAQDALKKQQAVLEAQEKTAREKAEAIQRDVEARTKKLFAQGRLDTKAQQELAGQAEKPLREAKEAREALEQNKAEQARVQKAIDEARKQVETGAAKAGGQAAVNRLEKAFGGNLPEAVQDALKVRAGLMTPQEKLRAREEQLRALADAGQLPKALLPKALEQARRESPMGKAKEELKEVQRQAKVARREMSQIDADVERWKAARPDWDTKDLEAGAKAYKKAQTELAQSNWARKEADSLRDLDLQYKVLKGDLTDVGAQMAKWEQEQEDMNLPIDPQKRAAHEYKLLQAEAQKVINQFNPEIEYQKNLKALNEMEAAGLFQGQGEAYNKAVQKAQETYRKAQAAISGGRDFDYGLGETPQWGPAAMKAAYAQARSFQGTGSTVGLLERIAIATEGQLRKNAIVIQAANLP